MESRLFAISIEELRYIIREEVEVALQKYITEPKEEEYLTITQAAKLLSIDRSTLWHWDKEGYLKKIHIGGKPRYKRSDIDRILQR